MTTLLRVTPDMLKQHNKKDDAWTAINGRVYNITPYLPYHPGGEKELMRVAGRDGTKLFGELPKLARSYPFLLIPKHSAHPCLGVCGDDDGYMHGWSTCIQLSIRSSTCSSPRIRMPRVTEHI